MTFIVIARTDADRDRGSGGQFGSHVEHVLSIYDYEIAIYRESETGLNKWSSQNLSYVKEVLVSSDIWSIRRASMQANYDIA